MSLVSSPSWALSEDDLVIRAGLYYEKFSATPFTGELDEGLIRGSFKNGKPEGSWEEYWENGQLKAKGDNRNGKREGSFEYYWDNGQLWMKGNYKNDKPEGYWVYFWDNGEEWLKGDYNNHEREGYWWSYNKDRSLNERETGTYKNGVKVGP